MKTTVLNTLFALALLTVSSFAKEEVNVYSHRHYEADKILFAEFEKQTGIKVNVVTAKAEELVTKLKIEGKNTQADMLITSDVGNLWQAKGFGLLSSVNSEILRQNVPAHFTDSDKEWFGLTKRARVIIYNKKKIDPKTIQSYMSLMEPKFNDKILVRSSSNAYNQSLLASIIAHEGEQKALEWAKGVVGNMARNPKGEDRDQIYGVATGDGDVAIVNTYYLAAMMASPNQKDRAVASSVGVVFPNQNGYGAHVNISGAGVVKWAKNYKNSVRLLEFLSSPAAQNIFAHSNFEYPINPAVKQDGVVTALGAFKEDGIELSKIGENNKKAVRIFSEAGWR